MTHSPLPLLPQRRSSRSQYATSSNFSSSLSRLVPIPFRFLFPAFILLFILPTRLTSTLHQPFHSLYTMVTTISFSSPSAFKCPDTPGVSSTTIVAACRNRHNTLRHNLPSWLAVHGVRQIVLIDWSSNPSITSVVRPRHGPRIDLIRVIGESDWVLSRAYNLAVDHAACPYILRTDCDYALDPHFLAQHNLSDDPQSFFTGNWLNAKDSNEIHLNGALLIARKHFLAVGGYDERIQSYGWDDTDLYNRLQTLNLTRRNVSYDFVAHAHHDDVVRAQSSVKFPQVNIDYNELLLNSLSKPWNRSMKQSNFSSSTYQIVADHRKDRISNGPRLVMRARNVPKSLQDIVHPHIKEEHWNLSLGRRLSMDYRVPWEVMDTMSSTFRERLLENLLHLRAELDEDSQSSPQSSIQLFNGTSVPIPTKARIIWIHCMYGVANRLKALASGLSFAHRARRVPIIIWEADESMTPLHELFEVDYLLVMDSFKPQWPLAGYAEHNDIWKDVTIYNYIASDEGSHRGLSVAYEKDKNIYFKGAMRLFSPAFTKRELNNRQLKSLQPTLVIQRRLEVLNQNGLKNAVGVHIWDPTKRDGIMESDIRDASRQNVHVKGMYLQTLSDMFAAEMENILKEDESVQFYIVSQSPAIKKRFEARFEGHVLNEEQWNSVDDVAVSARLAVIDMYALSRTKLLMTSYRGSFSEMVARLSGVKEWKAGIDFGSKLEAARPVRTKKQPFKNIKR